MVDKKDNSNSIKKIEKTNEKIEKAFRKLKKIVDNVKFKEIVKNPDEMTD